MITTQTMRRLEQLEARTDMHDDQPIQVTIDFVESNGEGRPSGWIKRVRWLGGEKISEEKIRVDPETLLRI